LGVIVVGIAVAIAIVLFSGNAQSSNRDAVTQDLVSIAAVAQEYYRKPAIFAGGGNSFNGFNLSPTDTGNENGSYSVDVAPSSSPVYKPGSTTPIPNPTQTIYLIGCGKEIGDDEMDPVKVCLKVTLDSLVSFPIN